MQHQVDSLGVLRFLLVPLQGLGLCRAPLPRRVQVLRLAMYQELLLLSLVRESRQVLFLESYFVEDQLFLR